MKIKYEISEDQVSNIYDSYNDVFVIETKPNLYHEGRKVGIIRYTIHVKKSRQYLKVKQYVTFVESRCKWQSSLKDGHNIVIIKSNWVSPYKRKQRIPVTVSVQKSKKDPETNERIYYEDFEDMQYTYTNYVNKRLLNDYFDKPYGWMKAYDNFKDRMDQFKDYYRAINETAKLYKIKHKELKEFCSEISNKKKQYKKEWMELKMRWLESRDIERELDEMSDEPSEKITSKVINFEDLRF